MKIISCISFLMLVLLLFPACENSYDGGNYNEQTQSHNYNNVPDVSVSNTQPGQTINNGSSFQDELNGNSEVRDIWQNYRVVINKLGDLKDKVVADIGAGPYGYFTLRIANNSEVKKIIAIDIDKEAIQFIENAKIILSEPVRNRIETRLVNPRDPNLKDEEADIVLIVNTYVYFDNAIDYLKNLKKGIGKDGKLVIIDFKKRNTPVGPPIAYRSAIGKVEQDLMEAGYVNIESDDQTLNYQYIVIAQPGLDN